MSKMPVKRVLLSLSIALLLLMMFCSLAMARTDVQDWAAMYEEEWKAMGLTQAPVNMAPPQGAPFEYALLTPETADIPDKEAFVIVLMGDGFTKEDMPKWHYYCQYAARNMVKYNPWDEYADIIKVYRIDVISNSSGVGRSDSADGRDVIGQDPKDTYFSGGMWLQNMARLTSADTKKAAALSEMYFGPEEECFTGKAVVLNTDVYGGSGGNPAKATLHWAYLDVLAHEITHGLFIPDEYLYSGTGQLNAAKANYKSEYSVVHRDWIDDPEWQEWCPWSRYLGKNGATFDPWTEGLTTDPDYINVFRPKCDCKMRYVGATLVWEETGEEEFPYCVMCKEKLRDRFTIMSAAPALHFEPYNDQFYTEDGVKLDNKNFIVRLPEEAGDELCVKVYGEDVSSVASADGLYGTLTMTVSKGGRAIYKNVPVTTKMDLEPGVYDVDAKFTGTYKGENITLSLRSKENCFEVKSKSIIKAVGKYAEPWNSTDKMDTLSRGWIADTPVTLPALEIDPAAAGGSRQDQFDITYSWHVRNFDGSAGEQLGETGIYPGKAVDGPSSVGSFVLCIHSKAKANAPAAAKGYDVVNEYPFDIDTPYHDASFYKIEGGKYSHELVSNDFRGVTIVGEGFTEAEQDKFEAAAEEFITRFLDTDPVKRMPERFTFFIENTMSANSGVTYEDGAQKNTYYGLQINKDGSIGTYRKDATLGVIMLKDAWRRDTNMKTWAQWGATVVLVNDDAVQANYNWRHPESNRAVLVSTLKDEGYSRLIESLVTQFAHVRSNRDADLLDTYRWMEGPEQNATFEETYQRLLESCYSHEMYGRGDANLPRPVVVSDAATKLYITDGTTVQGWDVPESFQAYSYGHLLETNVHETDTFTIRYYTDEGHRVGELLDAAPTAAGSYWAEADLPLGPKYYAKTETDRYGYTYEAGTPLQGRNGLGESNSTRVRGFVRFELVDPATYRDMPMLTLSNFVKAEAGETGVQKVTLKNLGSKPTTYTLTVENTLGWAATLAESSNRAAAAATLQVEVEAGQSKSLELSFRIPDGAAQKTYFVLAAKSDISGKEATAIGSIDPLQTVPFDYNTYAGKTQSLAPGYTGKDLDAMPDLDPKDWQIQEWMTWEDNYVPNPVIDWTTIDLPNAKHQKGLLILVDFEDKPFILSQPVKSDPLGNPTVQVAKENLAQNYLDTLNTPSPENNYTSIDQFWRENSYGNWKVDLEVYGPYTLPGMEWEYGIDGFNGARAAQKAVRPDAVELFLADKANHGRDLSDFTFGFIIHAGYNESSVWQEAGEMMFSSPQDVPEEFGPTVEELNSIRATGAKPLGLAEPIVNSRGVTTNDITWAKGLFDGIDESKTEGQLIVTDAKQGDNWLVTRYVPWTSWLAAKSVWSSASGVTAAEGDGSGLEPGVYFRISIQGENDGMATFAHEFGHIKSINDNYNNPYGIPDGRSYSGSWELMSRGSHVGPGGTHTRYEIPGGTGGSAPVPHTSRLKLKQDFYTSDQYNRFEEEYLIANGPVFETLVAREVPTSGQWGIGYGVNSIMIDMDKDMTPIVTKNDPEYNWQTSTWGSMRGEFSAENGYGYYQFYGMEVVQRVGYDSMSADDGVLITMNREIDNENAPWTWVIDSHPEDIKLVDFQRPDGTDATVSLGDARQLADALFHAGCGPDAVNEYVDEYNNLHFYVLDKMMDAQGVLSYRVAVMSEAFNGRYSDAMTVALGGQSEAMPGKIASQQLNITNKGSQPGLYRLSSENEGGWAWSLDSNLIEVAPGATVSVPLYVSVPAYRAKETAFSFTVTSEASGATATVEGSITPPVGADPEYKTYEGMTESVAPGFTGQDRATMPEMDAQGWKIPDTMRWTDWQDGPAIDWTAEELPDAALQRGLLLLVDYEDQPFVLTEAVGSDPLGNPQMQVDTRDLAAFWEEFLNVPSEMNNYTSIDGFWRENSYGKWKVEVEAYGPYTLPGMEWEYGIDKNCQGNAEGRGFTGSKPIIDHSIAAFLADENAPGLDEFTFGFIIHAGYDESGVWQEAGEMMFNSPEEVSDEFGPTEEELEAIRAFGAEGHDISWAEGLLKGDNWVKTRYVPWTSWVAAKSVWSHASSYTAKEGDGSGLAAGTSFRISVQGESDGMATFAHEFGHIKSIADNYNNPFGIPDGRSYTGPWELMSRGSHAGPEGTHTRWMIPGMLGSSVPAPHTTRLKLKQEFYEADQYNRFGEEYLIANGPVFETIVARETPTAGEFGIGYGVNSMMIDMDKDNTPIVTKNDPAYNWQTSTWGSMRNETYKDMGYYQFYSMEVVQRAGYDSFSQDDGVLIIMNREIDNESAPFMWVVDAHPEDIDLVDFVRPNGEEAKLVLGDARQLADALFHAGTGQDVVNEYVDEYNNLHFYVLDKMYDAQGVLSYRVAVMSEEFDGSYDDAMEAKLGAQSPAAANKVASQEIIITNKGSQPGLYRLDSENEGGWAWSLDSNLIEVAPGQSVSIPLYLKVPAMRAAENEFTFTVTSEASDAKAEVAGSLQPATTEAPKDGPTESVAPGYTGKDLRSIPEVDPQSWKLAQDMTWESDWRDNPVIQWDDMQLATNVTVHQGAVILVDFADRDFVTTMPKGSDLLGNPQLDPVPREELAQWWADFLNIPSELNNYTSINQFWRENSYGNWKVEMTGFGPYRLEGMEWEYGGPTNKRYLAGEAFEALFNDPEYLAYEGGLNYFNFSFILHAGYDESGLWEEYGSMLFPNKEDIPDEFGPTDEELEAMKAWRETADEDGKAPGVNWAGKPTMVDTTWVDGLLAGNNWAKTRYVEWTSWFASRAFWTTEHFYTIPDEFAGQSGLEGGTVYRISIQGENDGMATFAHEFGHITYLPDNYNNPYGKPDSRSYTGGWELMSRGSFAGPQGAHTRWQVPSVNGSSSPAENTVRNKWAQNFYDEEQMYIVDQADLRTNGPAFASVVARNVPAGDREYGIGYGVNGFIIELEEDLTPIIGKKDPEFNWQTSTFGEYNENTPYYGKGYYQQYSFEVVQRTGYDSFMTDEGVLLTKSRALDASDYDNQRAPMIWVVDSHPDDIGLVDYTRPDGSKNMVSLGDMRQLDDALFHAGMGEDVVSEYVDEYNNLHFYILDKMYDDAGVLSYRVAVRSDDFSGNYDDGITVELGGHSPSKAGHVASQEIIITNNGSQTGLYRLSSSNDRGWKWGLDNEVIELAPGESISIPLYMEVPSFRPQDNDFDFTVTSEVSGKSATVSGTIKPYGTSGVVDGGDDDDKPSKPDEDDKPIIKPEDKPSKPGNKPGDKPGDKPSVDTPVSELPFIDVPVNAWYYNDVLVAWKDGLINGRTSTTYVPDGNITVAEAIKLAATMHQLYTTGSVTLTNGTDAWYSTYVNYCIANGIIKEGKYTEMNAIATRAQFASVFASALPAEALKAINSVTDGEIPDVKMADSYGAAVYKLYNAGVLTGNDNAGTFAPLSNIKRSEVAAIVNRMMHTENRKTLGL